MIRLATRPGWQVVVIAQPPALQILQRHGHACLAVALPPVTTEDNAGAMLSVAREILAAEKPDIIVAGLSSPGDGGIDEALLAVRQVPALLMQDFWGEQNSYFGRGADAFLALDVLAQTINLAKHHKPSFIVGSPRHARLANLDLAAERRQIRQQLNTLHGQTVFGWFGQSLHHLSGYRRSLADWIDAVSAMGDCQILYKPHPREDETVRQETSAIFAAAGLPHQTLSGWSIERALLACDVATSILSNCLYDAAYLNHFSAEPLITPIAWLAEPDVREVFDAVVPVMELPYSSAGLALIVQDRSEVANVIPAACKTATRE
ncbi:MAG TPA: hypothetical protein VL017_08365, partial [Devosia sp.]|nr:hypothetical protein [Devosia sp.]